MRKVLSGTHSRIPSMKQAVRMSFRLRDNPLMISPGGNLNAASRQALMQKLARTEQAPVRPQPVYAIIVPCSSLHWSLIISHRAKPNIPQSLQSRSVVLKNMFNPEEYAIYPCCLVLLLTVSVTLVKPNTIGTRILPTMSKASAKKSMVTLTSSKSRKSLRLVGLDLYIAFYSWFSG